MSKQRRILIVEDLADIARVVQLNVEELNYAADWVQDGEAALEACARVVYDLVVLDLMLPKLDGLAVCRTLRAQQNYTPILMLTARAEECDRVVGLELGADDYLAKPFSIPELRARIRAILRRADAMAISQQKKSASLVHDGLVLDPSRREVTLNDTRIDLTAREFDLLQHLMRHPGQVYTRSQLLDTVWGYANESYEHNVNTHINRLRVKIEPILEVPCYVLTVRGVGYRFADRPH